MKTVDGDAKKRKAAVVINGGYFARGQNPMRHIGLLKSKDILIEPASNSVIRNKIRYKINRGAFAIFEDKSVDISWASTRNDSIFSWSFPFQNRPGKPASINYKFSMQRSKSHYKLSSRAIRIGYYIHSTIFKLASV